jgi:hypothetical protein
MCEPSGSGTWSDQRPARHGPECPSEQQMRLFLSRMPPLNRNSRNLRVAKGGWVVALDNRLPPVARTGEEDAAASPSLINTAKESLNNHIYRAAEWPRCGISVGLTWPTMGAAAEFAVRRVLQPLRPTLRP